MGYHGNILLKTNEGAGGARDRRPDLVGRREGGRESQTECLILWLVWNLPFDGK